MSAEERARTALSSRVIGEVLPISIATALAIESLIGQNPDAPVEDDHLDEFDSLYINVRTLVRNMLGAIQTEDKNIDLSPMLVMEYVINEMITIQAIMSEEASDVPVVFYAPSYEGVYKNRFKHGIVKEYKTKAQSYLLERELHVQRNIVKETKDMDTEFTIVEMDIEIPVDRVNVALLSHYPIDLLSRYQFNNLNLIESHTGAFKGPGEWYTKLTGYKDRSPIPFDKAMLQVFGDGTTFLSSARKLRTTFIELSEKFKWTYRSTEELIKFSAGSLNDRAFTIYVNELYSK